MPCSRSSSAAACVIALTPKAPAAQRPRPPAARRDEPPVTWTSVAGAPCVEQELAAGRQEREGRARGGGRPGVERLGLRLRDRAAAERAASIAPVGRRRVHDQVDAAVGRGRLFEHLPHAGLVRDVCPERERARGRHALERRVRPGRARHSPALVAQKLQRGHPEIPRAEDDGAAATRIAPIHARHPTPRMRGRRGRDRPSKHSNWGRLIGPERGKTWARP